MICPDCGYDNIEGMDRCENCMKPLRNLDVPRADSTGGLVRSVMEDDLSRVLVLNEKTLIVSPEASTGEVVRSMTEATTSCALVIDGGRLAGIFTEHDVLRRLAGAGNELLSTPIRDLMTPNPEALKETDSVAAALNKMAMGRYRNVPVQRLDGSFALTSIQQVLDYIAQEEW